MRGLAVLIPVLRRPERVGPVARSIQQAAPKDVKQRLEFICSPGDRAEIQEVRKLKLKPTVVGWEPGRADFQRKINLGFEKAKEEWVFIGADDLVFRPGWFEAAMEIYEETAACFIGVNDQGPRSRTRRNATHFLVRREYGECGTVDDSGILLSESYDHCFCDDEAVETAIWRSTFAYSPGSLFDHLHPLRGRGRMDSTYEKAMRHYAEDQKLYLRRRRLWTRRNP